MKPAMLAPLFFRGDKVIPSTDRTLSSGAFVNLYIFFCIYGSGWSINTPSSLVRGFILKIERKLFIIGSTLSLKMNIIVRGESTGVATLASSQPNTFDVEHNLCIKLYLNCNKRSYIQIHNFKNTVNSMLSTLTIELVKFKSQIYLYFICQVGSGEGTRVCADFT